MPFYSPTSPLLAADGGAVVLAGSIEFAGGTSDPDGLSGLGISAAAYDGSAGQFTVTFAGTGSLVLLAGPFFQMEADGKDFSCVLEDYDAATRTATFQVYDGTTATNPADGEKVQVFALALK